MESKNQFTNEDVTGYYDGSLGLYEQFMEEYDHRMMHCGYFDEDHQDIGASVVNLVKQVVDRIDVGPEDTVLDAGSGVGGPATWIAANRGADVIGINIHEKGIELGEELAAERGVEDRVEFRQDDYTELETVEDDEVTAFVSFDALCYADHSEVLEQAGRVVEDGGHISVSKYLETEENASADPTMRKWLDGWVIDELAHVDEFVETLTEEGFTDVDADNCTDETMRSWRIMNEMSQEMAPEIESGEFSEHEVGHAKGLQYTYETIGDLWGLYIVSATR